MSTLSTLFFLMRSVSCVVMYYRSEGDVIHGDVAGRIVVRLRFEYDLELHEGVDELHMFSPLRCSRGRQRC